MKKIFAVILVLILFISGCGKNENTTANLENKEFSNGVWLSYSEVNSLLTSEKGFKNEFATVITNLKSLKIDNIYVHVRAFCDSLYPSENFPLTKAAQNIDYDIFEYIVNTCHQNNIKVHAWINPYRVSNSHSDVSLLDKNNPAYKWLNDNIKENDINVIVQNGIYLNPAEEQVRNIVTGGIKEILEKYQVDGIHFDDYFYPTTDESFDKKSYENYLSSTDSPLSLADWRRANVNSLINESYIAVKFYSEDVLFSVSPAASVENNYSTLYADVEDWIENGYIDRIIPQLYFGFNYPDSSFNFDNLLEDWLKLSKKNEKVKLLIGLGFYKSGTTTPPDSAEWQNNTDIIARQVKLCKEKGTNGYIMFSYSYVFGSSETCTLERNNLLEYIN